MVGGTKFRRRVIHGEISRVLVLNLSGKTAVLPAPPSRSVPLTKPSLLSRATLESKVGAVARASHPSPLKAVETEIPFGFAQGRLSAREEKRGLSG